LWEVNKSFRGKKLRSPLLKQNPPERFEKAKKLRKGEVNRQTQGVKKKNEMECPSSNQAGVENRGGAPLFAASHCF